MQVQMDEVVTTSEKWIEPLRAGNLVEAIVKIGQHGGIPSKRPRLLRQDLEHGQTIDTLHIQLGAVAANLLECR